MGSDSLYGIYLLSAEFHLRRVGSDLRDRGVESDPQAERGGQSHGMGGDHHRGNHISMRAVRGDFICVTLHLRAKLCAHAALS